MDKQIKILFVEDNSNDYNLAVIQLERSGMSFVHKCVFLENEYISALADFMPDIIVSDYRLPEFNGMTALEIKKKLYPFIPFIIITGTINEETAVECIKAGANDYVLKDHILRLPPAVTNALKNAKDLEKKIEAELALKKSEEQYRELVEQAVVGIFITDSYGNFIFANEKGCRLLKIDKDEIAEQNLQSFFAAKDSSYIKNRLKDVLAEKTLHFEHEIVDLNGGTVPVEVNMKLMENGNILNIIADVTERKRAIESLKESEERFRNSFDYAAIGQIMTHVDGRFIKVNRAFCNLTGYSEDELYDKNILEITYPDDREKSLFAQKNLIENKIDAHHFNKRYISKTGETIYAEVSVIIQKDSNGTPLYLISQIQDTTEKEKAFDQLRTLSRVIEQSPFTVVITDINGIIEYINPKFSEKTGFAKEEVIGKSSNILKSGRTPLSTYRDLWNALTEGREWHGEFINKKKNGEIFIDYAIISSIKNSSGEIVHFVAVQEDITERKKAQEAIIKSELHFRSVWENSNDGMRLCDRNGIIIKANEAFGRLVDIPIEEIEGKKFNSVYFINSAESDFEFANIFSDRNAKTKVEAEIFLLNKKRIWVEISNSFIELENQPLMLLSIFRDITERKQFESEILSAKEKAEEMSRIKSSFLANMSHELRTPMIGILGYSEILKSELSDSNYKGMVEAIHKSGTRLLETLNLILDLSRIESGKHEISPGQFNLIQVINESVRLFEAAVKKKSLYIKFDYSKKDIICNLDERMLREILNNLINNAIKFTEKGGIEISVEEKITITPPSVLIRVKDTGVGIPSEKIDIIFDEFRQASEGYNRPFEGTGLGLTITKRFIELMKGSITVESRVKSGTAFNIILPLDLLFDKKLNHETKIKKSSPINLPEEMKEILIVDDDEATRDVLRMFSKRICKSDSAENAETAIQKVKQKIYSAVILDINLGQGMTGIDVIRVIRNMPEYKDTPVVALTAFSMAGDKIHFTKAGFTHYLSKPFTKEQFQKIISESLQVAQSK